MRQLTASEQAVLDALRAGFGGRLLGEKLADDPERGLWASFELQGHPVPTQVALGFFARQVKAGRSAEDAVACIVAGPPPEEMIPAVRIERMVPLKQLREAAAAAGLLGFALGAAMVLGLLFWIR